MFELIGRISLFPYDFAPAGWGSCDGQLVGISENDALFSLLGNTFGGDADQGSFALPDFRTSTHAGCQYCMAMVGVMGDYDEGVRLGETMISATYHQVKVRNLAECNGQAIPKANNMVLDTYLGKRFGDQGGDKIVLPDLRGKAPAKCQFVMATQGDMPDGNRLDPYVGQIFLFPFDLDSPMARERFRLCNGDVLKKQDNPALAALLANRFGGDGKETFGLPKIPAPPKFNYYISLRGVFPPRP